MKDKVKILAKAPVKWLLRRAYELESKRNAPRAKAILEEFAQRAEDVFFIQVGANDGSNDPVAELVVQKKWRGILVEPLDEPFRRLRERHQGNDRLIFEKSAVAERSGPRKMFRISNTNDRTSSLLAKNVEKAAGWTDASADDITSESIDCITFDDLLVKHGVKRVDLLVVDTEGYDFEILKTIDFAKVKPALVLYEEMHLSRKDQNACRRLLRSAGYRTTPFWGDVLCSK